MIPSAPVRPVLAALFLAVLLSACSPGSSPPAPEPTETVVSRYPDSTRKVVEVRTPDDSLLERRVYRPTGALRRVLRGDSVARYLELHDPDSARVLKDYLQGQWRNTSVDMSDAEASAYYEFTEESLTFRNPSGRSIETIDVRYNDHRTLVTEDGMPVTADIAHFDTVRVTGYTLVREDSTLSSPGRP